MIRHCLKVVAFALIVFPEPVTTALGILMLAVILALSFQKRLSKFGNLEVLVKRSLKNAKAEEPSLKIFKKSAVVFHELKTIPKPVLVSDHIKEIEKIHNSKRIKAPISEASSSGCDSQHPVNPERNFPVLQPGGWFDNRAVSEQVLHHTLRTSLPQYEAALSRMSTRDIRPIAAGKSPNLQQRALAKVSR